MPRWRVVAAQFLKDGQARRDDDAVMPGAPNMTVGVVLARYDEKHPSRIHKNSLAAYVELESARIGGDKLVFRRVPAGRRPVARRTEVFDTSQPA
jgi:hypothetical protein